MLQQKERSRAVVAVLTKGPRIKLPLAKVYASALFVHMQLGTATTTRCYIELHTLYKKAAESLAKT